MTRKLTSIGNSKGVILDRQTLAKAGWKGDESVEISVDDGTIILSLSNVNDNDPFASIRAKVAKKDPVLVDALITAACKAARKETIARNKRRP